MTIRSSHYAPVPRLPGRWPARSLIAFLAWSVLGGAAASAGGEYGHAELQGQGRLFPSAGDSLLKPGVCLELRMGPWRPPPPASADSLALLLPGRVRLESREPDETEGVIAVAPGTLGSVHDTRTWRSKNEGELELRFFSQRSGVTVRLVPDQAFSTVRPGGEEGPDRETARREQRYHGQARAEWDLPIPDHLAEARAESVACHAPLPADMRFRWEFRPAVPVEGGSPLMLGHLVPSEDLQPTGRDHVFELTLEPQGALEGADQVELEVGGDGRLTRIVATFPHEMERMRLLERLQDHWGPYSVAYGTSFRWLGRTMRYSMMTTPGGPWVVEMEIRLADTPVDAPEPEPSGFVLQAHEEILRPRLKTLDPGVTGVNP